MRRSRAQTSGTQEPTFRVARRYVGLGILVMIPIGCGSPAQQPAQTFAQAAALESETEDSCAGENANLDVEQLAGSGGALVEAQVQRVSEPEDHREEQGAHIGGHATVTTQRVEIRVLRSTGGLYATGELPSAGTTMEVQFLTRMRNYRQDGSQGLSCHESFNDEPGRAAPIAGRRLLLVLGRTDLARPMVQSAYRVTNESRMGESALSASLEAPVTEAFEILGRQVVQQRALMDGVVRETAPGNEGGQ